MNLQAIFICLALVSHVASVTLVFPTKDTVWTSTGPNAIRWTSNGTILFANIQLLHNNNTILLPSLLTNDGFLAAGIEIAVGEFFVVPYCIPGHPSLPTGDGYSLRMFSETPDGTKTTLALTNGTFSIIPGQPITCPGFSTSTTSGASLSGQPTGTTTASTSPSSKNHVGAIAGGVVGGLVACLLVAAVVTYNKRRRMVRLMTTQQFMMKKGLAIGKPVDSKDPEMH